MIKNLAMLGVATAAVEQQSEDVSQESAIPNGPVVVVTAPDFIKKSTLNRQFLFRAADIQRPKSVVACRVIQSMNAGLRAVPLLQRVGEDTEQLFSEQFLGSLSIVVNALDNMAARLYMDSRCIISRTPLLDSGTLGAKGHVQVVVPRVTEHFGARPDPPEQGIPFCTLKSFPHVIDHTIQWARDKFHALFTAKPKLLGDYLADPAAFVRLQRANAATSAAQAVFTVRTVLKQLSARPQSFLDCIALARIKFQKYFFNKISQLLFTLPLDHRAEDGSLFWTLPRRPPVPLQFDSSDPLHVDFLLHTALLLASVFHIRVPAGAADRGAVLEAVRDVAVLPFVPKAGVVVQTDPLAGEQTVPVAKADAESSSESVEQLLERLEAMRLRQEAPAARICGEEFEKDDDSNHHIDWIHAASSLRAQNYRITLCDRLKTKLVAGKIIPAIATTTSAVSGFAAVELVKVLCGLNSLSQLRNTYLNLGISLLCQTEPSPPVLTMVQGPLRMTVWDRWEFLQADATVQQFCDYFKVTYGLEVSAVLQGASLIFSPVFDRHIKRRSQKLRRYISLASKEQTSVDLTVTLETAEGVEVCAPTVRFVLRGAEK
eukprot:TRINITY_DN4246_c0_g1_i4.p1 TRINITY_DN4246_c0_g1~~TRINITY_DN4246_c0_g1_i4.p1  ORF type:complete len:601 (-),score=158.93 TRINITY_DN4246_c0_g1_i4:11-1813(-)